jgi:hypothetical protein
MKYNDIQNSQSHGILGPFNMLKGVGAREVFDLALASSLQVKPASPKHSV